MYTRCRSHYSSSSGTVVTTAEHRRPQRPGPSASAATRQAPMSYDAMCQNLVACGRCVLEEQEAVDKEEEDERQNAIEITERKMLAARYE